MSAPGGIGETAGTYKAVNDVAQFTDGMARLAELFLHHPELKWLQATTDPAGHVDIIVSAGTGVLRDWVHALPSARRKQDIYSIHSGAAYEELLVDGFLTVHVRDRGQS
jgi:hypothetical protein